MLEYDTDRVASGVRPAHGVSKRVTEMSKSAVVIVCIVAAAVLAAAIYLPPLLLGRLEGGVAAYETQTLKAVDYSKTVSFPVTIEADATAVPIPSNAGTVETVSVAVGDAVAIGDQLYAIDDGNAAARVRETESALGQASAARETAERNRDAAAETVSALESAEAQRGAPTLDEPLAKAKTVLDAAERALSAKNAEESSAKGALEKAKGDLAKLVARATAPGYVTEVNVRAGTPCASANDPSRSIVITDLEDARAVGAADGVSAGDTGAITLGGRAYDAVVTETAAGSAKMKTLQPCAAMVAGATGYAEVRVPVYGKTYVVPRGAVRRDGESCAMEMVLDGTTRIVAVEIIDETADGLLAVQSPDLLSGVPARVDFAG